MELGQKLICETNRKKNVMDFIPFEEAEPLLDWIELADFIADCHRLPPAQLSDQFLTRGENTLLSRAAWIDGMGSLVKTALVVPSNKARGLSTTNGAVTLFDDSSGELVALIDFRLVTKWKTAADSLLAALRLAPPDCANILILGAGSVARSLIEAYGAAFPKASFFIWNRTLSRAQEVTKTYRHRFNIFPVSDLETYVCQSDIIACATLSIEPLLKGQWLRPGCHIDLIGAFRADMREADDDAIRASRIFVDCFQTTVDEIGEIKIPIAQSVIERGDVLADFYDLPKGAFARVRDDEITLFKNGGGAHLDLMTAHYILSKWCQSKTI